MYFFQDVFCMLEKNIRKGYNNDDRNEFKMQTAMTLSFKNMQNLIFGFLHKNKHKIKFSFGRRYSNLIQCSWVRLDTLMILFDKLLYSDTILLTLMSYHQKLILLQIFINETLSLDELFMTNFKKQEIVQRFIYITKCKEDENYYYTCMFIFTIKKLLLLMNIVDVDKFVSDFPNTNQIWMYKDILELCTTLK